MNTDTAPTAADLAALLASRVCHDLAGPTSAMGAAISVLDDEDASDMRDDAVELLRNGARQIRAKLEYARVCFGAAGARAGEMSLAEVRTLADPMFSDARPDLTWRVEASGIEKTAVRVLLNFVWLAVEALPRGGEVVVEASPSADGGARLRVTASGPRVYLEDAFSAAMAGRRPDDGFDGRNIQPYYAGLIARESGGRAEARLEEGRAEFTALTGPAKQARDAA